MRFRKGIFIYGYYGFGNLGDDLLLVSVIKGLQQFFPDAVYYIRNYGGIPILSTVETNVELTNIEQVLYKPSSVKIYKYLLYFYKFWRYVRQCNYFILGGGTLIQDKKSMTSLIILLFMIFICRIQRVKVIGMGIGISQLNSGISRFVLRVIVNNSKIFYVRDEASLKECKIAKCHARVQLSTDMVYSIAELIKSKNEEKGTRKRWTNTVALTISAPAFNLVKDEEKRVALIKELISLIESIQNEGMIVKLVVFQSSEKNINIGDDTFFQNICKELDIRGQVLPEIINIQKNPARISDFFNSIDYLIGMRFHSLILAALFEAPFLGISYDNKINQICTDYQSPCINLEDMNHDKILKLVKNNWRSKPNNNITFYLIKKSKQNFDIFK